MSQKVRKFINPKFLATADLALMAELFERHAGEITAFDISCLHGDESAGRAALRAFFERADGWPEALVADLHRIADLGEGPSIEIMLERARRAGVSLHDGAAEGDAPPQHDPKHLALRLYLHHRTVFEEAADWRAMMAPPGPAEFAGSERGVGADLTREKIDRFRLEIVRIFEADLQGDYCRLGPYQEDGEINMVVSHGSVVSTMPIVRGSDERVVSIRAVRYSVLRYAEETGVLMLAGFAKARQAEIAELFASSILDRPGFFDHSGARQLYALMPIERAGASFAFRHAHDRTIARVAVMAVTSDLMEEDDRGRRRPAWTIVSKSSAGEAVALLEDTPVDYSGAWEAGELVFRVWFHGEGKRQSQVTVRLKPPSTLDFKRARFEYQIKTLLERNGFVVDRDADRLVDAAE